MFRPSVVFSNNDVIQEEADKEEKLSTINDCEEKKLTDELDQYSPLNYLRQTTPSNAGTPSAKTLKFT